MPFGTESEDVVRMYQFILVCFVSLKLSISLSKRPDFNEKKSNLVNLWSLPCLKFPILSPSSSFLVPSRIPNPIYFFSQTAGSKKFFFRTNRGGKLRVKLVLDIPKRGLRSVDGGK